MMKIAAFLAVLALGHAQTSNPIEKAVQMLQDMRQVVQKEEEAALATHKETMEFCRSTKQELEHSIEVNKDKIEELTATNQKANADINTLTSQIGELANLIQQNGEDLAAAKSLRKSENKDFLAAENELSEAVDMLSRAMSVLRKAMPGSALLQRSSSSLMEVVDAVEVVMQSAAINTASKQKLTALLQGDSFGEPDAVVYESKAGSIIDVLAGMKRDAEQDKTKAQMAEMKAQNAHNLVVQGLTDSTASATADKDRKNGELQAAKELAGKSEGDLAEENTSLKTNEDMLATTTQDCADKKEEYETQSKGRAEEVDVIGQALEVLENPEFASAQSSRQGASFLQISDNGRAKVVSMLEGMARRFHSTKLAELAMTSRAAAGDDNVFAKVMGMIQGMIDRLKKQAAEEQDKHAYCVKNIAETKAKQEKIQGNLDNLSARLEQANADRGTLKTEISDLSKEITDLNTAVAEATKIRNEEAANFAKAQAEFQTGIAGLEQAIKILSEYFGADNDKGHEQHTGTATTIISMLSTTNEDFTNGLAEAQQAEQQAQKDFDKFAQESKVTLAQKDATLKAKSEEVIRLSAAIQDLEQDMTTSSEEKAAVDKAMAKLQDMCTHKVMSFEERMEKMTAEIDGLKQALKILENETA